MSRGVAVLVPPIGNQPPPQWLGTRNLQNVVQNNAHQCVRPKVPTGTLTQHFWHPPFSGPLSDLATNVAGAPQTK